MTAYRVTLLGSEPVHFDVRPHETILAAAERQGVQMLHGCRAGACRTCACRLVSGKVHMPEGTSLTQQMVDANVVLTCVATVAADSELVTGRRGKTLLHPKHILPWTE